MPLFVVTYQYAAGSAAGRDEHRLLHLEFLQDLYDSGRLLISGPTDAGGPKPGALLIVRGESTDEVETIMGQDPFDQRGYVERDVRPWDLKFGADRLASAAFGAR